MITRGLLVASQIDHSVREYDRTTGAFVRVAASALGDPLGLIVGLDGNLLVSDGQTNQVKRYDIGTGKGFFVEPTVFADVDPRMTIARGLPPNGGGAETPGRVAKSGRTLNSAAS